jgi:hypothetical protein
MGKEDAMKTHFELPLGKIFGGETTSGFKDVQKLLGFWEGRAFRHCLKMLTELLSRHKWIDYLGISASGYDISSVDQVSDSLPNETVIVASYANGRIDRFEVIGGKLRHYDRIDEWPEYLFPKKERSDCFQEGASLSLTRVKDGARMLSKSNILRIIVYAPLKGIEEK